MFKEWRLLKSESCLRIEKGQVLSLFAGKTLSREFFELVKNIGEAKSKQEEDYLMRHECKKLQEVIFLLIWERVYDWESVRVREKRERRGRERERRERGSNIVFFLYHYALLLLVLLLNLLKELKEPEPKKLKEYLIRLMYCEMFGFKSEFGYIHAINLTQDKNDLVIFFSFFFFFSPPFYLSLLSQKGCKESRISCLLYVSSSRTWVVDSRHQLRSKGFSKR